MRALVLAVLLCSPSLAQAQAPATRMYPMAAVHELWVKVQACAGPAVDPSKTFDQIVWMLRAPEASRYQGSQLKAEWVAPDTIFVTRGYEREGWVIAHEMLHHAMNGPQGFDKHPLNPFMFPCGLMEFQQHAGGMGGGTPLPTRYAATDFVPGKR